MKDKQTSHPATSPRTVFWWVALALPIFLWCWGSLISHFMGCSPPQALLKATAYALSGLAGWIAYLLVRRPCDVSFGSLFPASYAAMGNTTMLGPTRAPWPFPDMLAHGLIATVLFMSLVGLVFRLLRVGE